MQSKGTPYNQNASPSQGIPRDKFRDTSSSRCEFFWLWQKTHTNTMRLCNIHAYRTSSRNQTLQLGGVSPRCSPLHHPVACSYEFIKGDLATVTFMWVHLCCLCGIAAPNNNNSLGITFKCVCIVWTVCGTVIAKQYKCSPMYFHQLLPEIQCKTRAIIQSLTCCNTAVISIWCHDPGCLKWVIRLVIKLSERFPLRNMTDGQWGTELL